MNTIYIPIERYAVENAQHDAIRLFNETGVKHIVETAFLLLYLLTLTMKANPS
ncbi:MAG: hypothetical protein PHC99_12285 [Methylococcales bacterium]|nr:hypothetical protein [Methylococcales bacterium]